MNILDEKIISLQHDLRRALRELLERNESRVLGSFQFNVFDNAYDNIFTTTDENERRYYIFLGTLFDNLIDYLRTQNLDNLFSTLENNLFHRVLQKSPNKKSLEKNLTNVILFDVEKFRGDIYYNAIQHTHTEILRVFPEVMNNNV